MGRVFEAHPTARYRSSLAIDGSSFSSSPAPRCPGLTPRSDGWFPLVGSLDDLPVPEDLEPRERVQDPDPALVRRAGLAAREHTLEGLDRATGAPPEDLDELVAEVARLLGIRHGWGL